MTKSRDDAFYYRICTIPFKYSIPREYQNTGLQGELLQERDGIVTKAIAAYFRLVDNKYFFAGDFKVNEVISTDEPTDLDYRIRLYEFVKDRFCKDEPGRVFIEDAYNAFSANVGGIPLGEFSNNFQRFAAEIYGAKKTRKRRPGTVNPISCVEGISFVDDGLDGTT